ncbi:CPBP family intramembrane glutamic endopeptidase [Nicoliella lavandulae]|uniref:Type II CAAX endopeptidase family protein n=1 Tax=Nicoliella lavandulae TaxID=3082954 RepID=A0ABU8SIX4_9LACO
MKKHLTFGEYFSRAVLFAVLYLWVGAAQLPMLHIKTSNPLLVNLGWVLVYFVSYAGLIAVLMNRYRYYHQAPLTKLTSDNMGLVGIAYVIFMAFQVIMLMLLQVIYHQGQSENNVVIQKLATSNSIVLCVMLVGIIILSPIVEELLFRGFIVDGFFKGSRVIWPMLVSGFIFSSGHLNSNIISFLIYAVMGALLVYLYHRTGNIKASIAFHILNNLVASFGLIQLFLTK